MAKKDLEKKSESIKNLIDGIVDETIDVPDDAIIFLDPSALIEIFTKKRMEIVQYINQFNPKSIQELAELTGRKKQAVNRDLKILKQHDIVKLEKEGRTVKPRIDKKILMFGLSEIRLGAV